MKAVGLSWADAAPARAVSAHTKEIIILFIQPLSGNE
jgi:hypothetical protein